MNYNAALDVSLPIANLRIIDEQEEVKAETNLTSEMEEVASR